MTDKTDQPVIPKTLPLRDPHEVRTEFVNQLVASGHLNGVVNLTFATAQFTPAEVGDGAVPVPADLVIASRLRMDVYCAHQLYVRLGEMLAPLLAQQNGTTH